MSPKPRSQCGSLSATCKTTWSSSAETGNYPICQLRRVHIDLNRTFCSQANFRRFKDLHPQLAIPEAIPLSPYKSSTQQTEFRIVNRQIQTVDIGQICPVYSRKNINDSNFSSGTNIQGISGKSSDIKENTIPLSPIFYVMMAGFRSSGSLS